MMNLNKKIALIILAIFSFTNLALASVKTDLTSRLSTLETKYSTLKISEQDNLKAKVTALNTEYSNIFKNL
jgi:Na+-transporting NADH:ubiquinone oxidoreductase subunit NqrF